MGSFNDLLRGLNEVTRDSKIVRTSLTSVLPVHKKRIFEQGSATSGARIGTYGTKKISIAKKNQARNTGHTVFPGGYAQYKSEVGKNPGFVNLDNTSQMKQDYGMQVSGKDVAFGFQNSFNAQKSGWMEDKYKKDIFALTDKENSLFVDVQSKLLKEQLEKYIR